MSATSPPPVQSPPLPNMSSAVARLGRLVRKELSEILRDRRTIITLVLMPLLLYPLLSIAFQQFFLASNLHRKDAPAFRVGFRSEADREPFLEQLRKGQETLTRLTPRDQGQADEEQPRLEVPVARFHLEQAVLARLIDVGVKVRQAETVGQDVTLDYEVIYLRDSAHSLEAVEYIERRMAAANNSVLATRLGLEGAEPATLLRLVREPVADPSPQSVVSLAALVPLILILMTITGAVYPAIDLTAGERERGTLEILVAAPVPRLGLLFAKYVTVVTVAVLTAVINLTTMLVTISLSGLSPLLFERGLTVGLIVQIFALLLLFAAFFSALLLTLTSFARSFKEAQAYLIPLMLASLAPGLVGMVPGLHLSGALAVVPLVNIVLLARDLLHGNVSPTIAVLVICSTLLYAAAAIAAAARIFGAEGVLYNEQSSWSDLFRRPAEPSATPTVAGALFCQALMFPTFFVLDGVCRTLLAEEDQELRLRVRLVLLVLVSVLLFGVFPLIAALLRRVRLRSGFLLLPAAWPAYLAGVLLGLSLWPFVIELLAFLQTQGWTTLSREEQTRVMMPLRRLQESLPLWVLIAAMVIPALFEELFFRGFLFSALRAHSGPATTVLVSAALFGLFHLVVTNSFAFERLLPSALLGVILGWVCWRNNSVWPGMLLHACHNSALILVNHWQQGRGTTADALQSAHLPVSWLLAAAVVAAVGMALLYWGVPAQRVRSDADAGDVVP